MYADYVYASLCTVSVSGLTYLLISLFLSSVLYVTDMDYMVPCPVTVSAP